MSNLSFLIIRSCLLFTSRSNAQLERIILEICDAF